MRRKAMVSDLQRSKPTYPPTVATSLAPRPRRHGWRRAAVHLLKIEKLSDSQATLREPWFYTPYDDLTVMTGKVQLGKAPDHAVLTREVDFRFFENRTEGQNDAARAAVMELKAALHANKRRVLMRPGDFVS